MKYINFQKRAGITNLGSIKLKQGKIIINANTKSMTKRKSPTSLRAPIQLIPAISLAMSKQSPYGGVIRPKLSETTPTIAKWSG